MRYALLASLGAIVGAITSFSLATAATHHSATLLTDELAKPQFVTLDGGRRINAFCIGRGRSTIVFEQGGEGNIANWKFVAPSIAATSRACFYDRAGFGYSDAPPGDVTPEAVTNDLRAVLRKLKIAGPVILVGHSIGGFYATVFADRFPAQVAGLVLVEAGFSGQEQWKSAEEGEMDRQSIWKGEANLLRCADLARAGKLNRDTVKMEGCFPPISSQASREEVAYAEYALSRPAWYESEYSQSLQFFSRDQKLSSAAEYEVRIRRNFGEMPIRVLTAQTTPKSAWRTEDQQRRLSEQGRSGHQALARRSNRGRWVEVPASGHFVQVDQPEAVIAAISEVVAELR